MRVPPEAQAHYLNETFGLQDPDLLRVRERMLERKKEGISISGAEARILQFLIRGFGLRRVVEFGTLFGYSALAMAKVLPDDGFVVTLEKDPAHFAAARETFASCPEAGRKVISMCGDALELVDEVSARGPFDLVFIDANKAGYVDYLNWAEENLRTGGLIVGDNTFVWGALWDLAARGHVGEKSARAMAEFNARLADPEKYNSILIPTSEGLTVAQKL